MKRKLIICLAWITVMVSATIGTVIDTVTFPISMVLIMTSDDYSRYIGRYYRKWRVTIKALVALTKDDQEEAWKNYLIMKSLSGQMK